MTMIYKGAAPNTYWHLNDPRNLGGFTAGNLHLQRSANIAVTHITQSSRRSPFISFTYSFAVAVQYAIDGATKNNQGVVYAIDTSGINSRLFYDPVKELASTFSTVHAHDGGQNLIIGISDQTQQNILFVPPERPPGAAAIPPQVTNHLQAIVKAIRDAEVLLPTFSIGTQYIQVYNVY